jgi:sporulation integral membrane protein YtvI
VFNYLNLDKGKLKKLGIAILLIALGVFLAYKAIYYFAPFILALIIAAAIEPVNKVFINKFGIKRGIAAAINVILAVLIVGGLLTVLGNLAFSGLKAVVKELPMLYHDVRRAIMNINVENEYLLQAINLFNENLDAISKEAFGSVYGFANIVFNKTLLTVQSFPKILIFIIVTVLSTYFMSSGKDTIIQYLKSKVPKLWVRNARKVRVGVFSSMFRLLKGYMLIVLITFTELFIGLSIIGIRYAALLAVIVSIIDILPVLGTGLILIPWFIICFATGNIKIGISILILYLIILVVRQTIEPKIVSSQIGVHPLVTLMAMYFTYKLIGAGGLIAGPIAVVIITNIYNTLYRADKKVIKEQT